MNLESEVYKSIETYSPPNLKKYISTEVEQLLSSKVALFDRSECMTSFKVCWAFIQTG